MKIMTGESSQALLKFLTDLKILTGGQAKPLSIQDFQANKDFQLGCFVFDFPVKFPENQSKSTRTSNLYVPLEILIEVKILTGAKPSLTNYNIENLIVLMILACHN